MMMNVRCIIIHILDDIPHKAASSDTLLHPVVKVVALL